VFDPSLPDPTAVAIGAPIVTGIVEGAKQAGLNSRYANVAALAIGFGVAMLLVDDPTSRSAVLTSIATGLTATGLYEAGHTMLGIGQGGSANGTGH
jgi:hypothetical protein